MGAEITTEITEEQPALKPSRKKKKSNKLEIRTEKIDSKESANLSFAENLGEKVGQLAVDVYETEGELVIQSTIAGVKPENLDISIEADRVSIRGERAEQTQEEGKNYFYQECYWGAFSREIILPTETDPGRAQATMKNGVLTIRLPKIDREKKRKIEVKS